MIPKFRVWDKEENRMIDDYEVLISSDGCAYYNHYEGGLRDLGFDVEIMQSTGLKDKNDVEVYEGDIVRCSRGCPHLIYWEKELGGTYIGGMPAWYLSGLNGGYAWTGTEEIIGNIYENPELLEGHEK
ncbi:YopX family protein [Lactococcus taiwanensis]|uniref:YopX family protein n=1 Tax=Lactococcus taiwanensis TaxID=1151742 RepID=UPI0028AB413D|nr:YopX family protein [Lactococcus taiwanensis]